MAVRRPIKPVIDDLTITTEKLADDAVNEFKLDPFALSASTSMMWVDSVQDSDFTAILNRKYFVDTTDGEITCTMPDSAFIGDEIWFHDLTGKWSTNKLVLDAHSVGDTIMSNSDFDADIINDTVICVYAGEDWRVII